MVKYLKFPRKTAQLTMAKVALLIGVSKYESDLSSLPAAVKDIVALERIFKDPELGAFDSVQTLPNPDSQTMQEAIETLLENRTKDDLVVLFFSGHGIKDDDYKLHFATCNTRKNAQGHLIRSTAVAARFIHDLINCNSNRTLRRLVIILDCCFSGAFDPALSAKDGGSLNLASELGAEGRVVLTASDSTQYAFEQKGADLSIYTRYLVEGMETSAGDQNEDGWVSVSELHDYAARKVRQAAPSMTPQMITLKGNISQGIDIKLTKAKLADPKVKFRKILTRYAQDGQIRPAAKVTLENYRKQFGLTAEEATQIINEFLRPFQEYLENLQQYRAACFASAEHEYPYSQIELESLQDLQRLLSLREEDILPIQGEVEAKFALKLQKIDIQTIKITAIKNAKAIVKTETKQVEIFTENLGNGVRLEMVKIPAGRFWMGQTDAEKKKFISQYGEKDYQYYFANELPRHQVSLQSFFMGKFPVTQAQYQQIMGDNPSIFKDFPNSANHPVEGVSWLEADQFCQKLSQQTGRAYHLATEAQWEYGCRAGTETPFAFGETITTDYVNYDGNVPYGDAPKGEYRQQTIPVGQFSPNGFGLYDCHGNVWEWCADCWHDSYTDKPDSIKNNGSIIWSDSNKYIRLLRGGSWCGYSRHCRSAGRDGGYADYRNFNVGFRLALSLL
jgi:formylglycine-generating enzyme required for sulfatase activity/uncharacterized caspase-like protein